MSLYEKKIMLKYFLATAIFSVRPTRLKFDFYGPKLAFFMGGPKFTAWPYITLGSVINTHQYLYFEAFKFEGNSFISYVRPITVKMRRNDKFEHDLKKIICSSWMTIFIMGTLHINIWSIKSVHAKFYWNLSISYVRPSYLKILIFSQNQLAVSVVVRIDWAHAGKEILKERCLWRIYYWS